MFGGIFETDTRLTGAAKCELRDGITGGVKKEA